MTVLSHYGAYNSISQKQFERGGFHVTWYAFVFSISHFRTNRFSLFSLRKVDHVLRFLDFTVSNCSTFYRFHKFGPILARICEFRKTTSQNDSRHVSHVISFWFESEHVINFSKRKKRKSTGSKVWNRENECISGHMEIASFELLLWNRVIGPVQIPMRSPTLVGKSVKYWRPWIMLARLLLKMDILVYTVWVIPVIKDAIAVPYWRIHEYWRISDDPGWLIPRRR